MNTSINRLYRSPNDRMIGGVCGGLGKFLGIDSTVVRLIFVFTAFFWPFIALVYLVLLLVVPEEPLIQATSSITSETNSTETTEEN